MSEATKIYQNLDGQTFRLNKVNQIRDYFIAEVGERELINERLNKYISTFDYFDKSFMILVQQVIAFLLFHLLLLMVLL